MDENNKNLMPPLEEGEGTENELEEKAREEGGGEPGENFGSMFEESQKEKQRRSEEGEIIHGLIVSVGKDSVMVDIGGKSEGQIPMAEFTRGEGKPGPQGGDEVWVIIEGRDEDTGVLILSKEKAEKRKIWDDLDHAFRGDLAVEGTMVEKVKGGIGVDIGGVRAFLPGSQVDVRPVRNLEQMLGVKDRFKIIKFNRKRGNVVVSRRVLMEKTRDQARLKTLAHLEKDQVVKGRVKNITDYGAFVDLGGIDGLLHITDMSYGRIGHPSEVIMVGDEVTVKVLKFNRETERVSLGLKQCLPDPWENVDKKYPVGTIVQGKVVSITDYGAFVELEEGVEGLVHVSEMSWSRKRVHPSKIVTAGQQAEAKVLDIDLLNHRISLGLKQAMPNPWDELMDKYPPGSRVRGKVRNITNFGIFVGVEEGIDGLVHISDLSWIKRVKHPSELFKKGQEVDCVVLNIDKDNERFSLGIKQIEADPWMSVPVKYRPGDEVTGKVVNITDFGVFVELEEGIEGLIHITELSREKVKDPSEVVQPGQQVTAEILNVDSADRKIRLSIKARERSEEQRAYREFKHQEGDGTSKLGEIIHDKLSKLKTAALALAQAKNAAEPPAPEPAPAEKPPTPDQTPPPESEPEEPKDSED